MATGAGKSDQKGKMSQEQIIAGFQELRNQQRAIASKISEIDMDRKEHDLVVEALKEVEPDKKCFRLVGSVLVERTAKEVLPALVTNREQLGKLVTTFGEQLENKGREINEYREKHNIRVRGEEDSTNQNNDKKSKSTSSGVLVASEAS